jgi:hypothetical protein
VQQAGTTRLDVRPELALKVERGNAVRGEPALGAGQRQLAGNRAKLPAVLDRHCRGVSLPRFVPRLPLPARP